MVLYVLIVILTMVNAVIAVHLGLSAAIAKILVKVLTCPKCLTFWSSLGLLYIVGCNLLIAVLLSLLSAYASNWFAILLVKLTQYYDKLWQSVNRK